MSQNVRQRDKSRRPPPASQWSSVLFIITQRFWAGHACSGVAQISADWLVTWFNALATKEPSEKSPLSMEKHWLSTACSRKCTLCACDSGENHPSQEVSYAAFFYFCGPVRSLKIQFSLCHNKKSVQLCGERLLLGCNKYQLYSVFTLS